MRTVLIQLNELRARAKVRPDVNLEEFLAQGTINGPMFEIDTKLYLEFWNKYNHSKVPAVSKCCGQKNTAPPMGTKIKNFAGSMLTVAKDGIRGKPVMAVKEEFERRITICKQCEFFNQQYETCTKCGCKMAYKARLEALHCPLQLW